MSKKLKKKQKDSSIPGVAFVKKVGNISEYRLKSNNLRILHQHRKGTGVVTTNITYCVGARDEARGETGLAHMLEHMLFKPTKQDLKKKIDSGAMHFERETGCILNANTWRDRTTYFFSYPTQYFERALQIEAERMTDVVLSDKEFQPERGNVLSEFDMYSGDPHFALSVVMNGAAFQSHPYGHETIGYREDIERYTVEKLKRFYVQYYRPDNATMMVIGDIESNEALQGIKKLFTSLKNPTAPVLRHACVEPKQEGVRRTEISRPSTTNILTLGVKHAAFPTQDWYATWVLFSILTDGPDSILHKKFVDTGKAIHVASSVEPASEESLGTITVTLAEDVAHNTIEAEIMEAIQDVQTKDITKHTKKVLQQILTGEFFTQDSSLTIAMEMTEYVAAGVWEEHCKTEEKIKAISPAKLIALKKQLFTQENMTIGNFVGKK